MMLSNFTSEAFSRDLFGGFLFGESFGQLCKIENVIISNLRSRISTRVNILVKQISNSIIKFSFDYKKMYET